MFYRTYAVAMAIALSGAFFTHAVFATPAQVIIIRHAEKDRSGPELNRLGKKRARKLVKLFLNEPELTQYGTPVAIYAASTNPNTGSIRAVETVTPLAEALHLSINTKFANSQTDELAREILNEPAYDGKLVLVCWSHHLGFVHLAEALGVNPVPGRWHGRDFNRLWKIDYRDGQVSNFEDLSQRLLRDDPED